MNKKRLPKAIMRSVGDMRGAVPALAVIERQAHASRTPELPEGVAAGPAQADSADLEEQAAPVSSPPAVPAHPAPRRVGAGETRRRSQARSIVERHAIYSAVGGLIPLPIANVASITAVIVRMVRALSDLYGVPFERDRARAIVIGLMGGAMPTGLAAVTSSTLIYVVPGSNLIGLAVSSLTGAACTRGIGRIFVEHFESGATLVDFPMVVQR
jgi:uncharacterized protein (DUF697 family)